MHEIIVSILLALIFAYLLNPLLNLLMKAKISRFKAVLALYFIILVFLIFIIYTLLPILLKQLTSLISKLPILYSLIEIYIKKLDVFFINHNLITANNIDNASLKDIFNLIYKQNAGVLKSLLSDHISQTGTAINMFFGIFSKSAETIVSFLICPIFGLLISYYILKDLDDLKEILISIIPPKFRSSVKDLALECNKMLMSFVKGQLIVSIILAIFYAITFKVLHLDLALILGIISGFLSIIPYLGTFIGLFLTSIFAFIHFHDFLHVIYIVGIFIFAHVLQHFALIPNLIGDRIGLHPAISIIVLFVGGYEYGVTGLLLALPLTAFINICLKRLKAAYTKSNFYNQS